MDSKKRTKSDDTTSIVHSIIVHTSRSHWQGIARLFVRVLQQKRVRSRRLTSYRNNGVRLARARRHPPACNPTRTRTRTKKPSLYKVLMLNDDYTPMEFVVHVLQSFFRMDMEEATRVMLHVHQRGVGICGIFSYEVAETKVNQVMDFARQNQHPLQCTLEKA